MQLIIYLAIRDGLGLVSRRALVLPFASAGNSTESKLVRISAAFEALADATLAHRPGTVASS